MNNIAFDCNGTLDKKEVLELLGEFFKSGWNITIHSSLGKKYAEETASSFGLESLVKQGLIKCSDKGGYYLIAVDDVGYKNCQFLIKVSNAL